MEAFQTQGIKLPRLGLGTYRMQGDVCRAAVESGLALGYRHIDTAEMYGNEDAIGAAIASSGVPRSELHVTTKVWNENLTPDAMRRAFDASLKKLRLDVVDLYLVHWPKEGMHLPSMFETLMKLKEERRARAIGVANFNIALVEETMRLSPEPLATLQAEYHPYLDQTRVLEFCKRAGIVFTAYCPLGRGRLFKDPVIAEIARVKGRTIAQVALRWQIQQGNIAPIPRSANPAHMAESLAVFDFTLTDEEMRRIHALARPDGRIANPAGRAPAWD